MQSLAMSLFLDSKVSVDQELPYAGTPLENPFVYDSVARDFKQMAKCGLVEIVQERSHESSAGTLIDSLRFRRVRNG